MVNFWSGWKIFCWFWPTGGWLPSIVPHVLDQNLRSLQGSQNRTRSTLWKSSCWRYIVLLSPHWTFVWALDHGTCRLITSRSWYMFDLTQVSSSAPFTHQYISLIIAHHDSLLNYLLQSVWYFPIIDILYTIVDFLEYSPLESKYYIFLSCKIFYSRSAIMILSHQLIRFSSRSRHLITKNAVYTF